MSAPKEPLFTSNRLSLLSGLDRRTVEKRLLKITPAKEDSRGNAYRLADALPALVQTPENAEAEKRILDSREREAAAKADIAEVDSMLKIKSAVPRSTADMFVSENRIAVRRLIEQELPEAQAQKLLAKIRKIRIPLPEEYAHR